MKPEKLDRTSFKHQSVHEAEHNLEYWKKQSYTRRLESSYYLNSVAYNFDINNPPRMDKTYFKIRKRK